MNRSIQDIYTHYRIQPFLQLHMLRVTAVATTIIDAHIRAGKEVTDRSELISACLLHDMGNILKFDLESDISQFPESVEPEGIDYWIGVQKEIMDTYGSDVEVATHAIADELNVSKRTKEILGSVGSWFVKKSWNDHDLMCMIADYSDMRVRPEGVVPMLERFHETNKRYAHRVEWKDQEKILETEQTLIDMEKELFKDLDITPEDITEESTTVIRESLSSFEIC